MATADAGLLLERAAPRSPQTPAPTLAPPLRSQLVLLAADLVTVLGAGWLTYFGYLALGIGRRHYDPALYSQVIGIFAMCTVAALHARGAYSAELGLLKIEAIQRVIRAVAAGVLLTLGFSFVAKLPQTSRATILLLGPIATLALVALRYTIWTSAGSTRRTAGALPVLIYGAGETGRLLARRLLEESPLGLDPIGFFDDRAELRGERFDTTPGGVPLPVLGGEEQIEAVWRETGAAAVFLAMPSASSERVAHLILTLDRKGIPFFFVPSAGSVLFSSLRFREIAGLPVFARRGPQQRGVYPVLKRGCDVLAAACLLVVAAPALGLVAALVKLTSPGPVLFRQARVGLHGRTFTIYKLRTMTIDSPRYGTHPQAPDDPRVTSIGRWLRRFSIDELPQLWNVLAGDMSMVGPRPEMPFLVERYNQTQLQRLDVLPGLTGLWQISADRGVEIHENVHYDLYYVENQCLSLDAAILMLTPFAVLANRQAM